MFRANAWQVNLEVVHIGFGQGPGVGAKGVAEPFAVKLAELRHLFHCPPVARILPDSIQQSFDRGAPFDLLRRTVFGGKDPEAAPESQALRAAVPEDRRNSAESGPAPKSGLSPAKKSGSASSRWQTENPAIPRKSRCCLLQNPPCHDRGRNNAGNRAQLESHRRRAVRSACPRIRKFQEPRYKWQCCNIQKTQLLRLLPGIAPDIGIKNVQTAAEGLVPCQPGGGHFVIAAILIIVQVLSHG